MTKQNNMKRKSKRKNDKIYLSNSWNLTKANKKEQKMEHDLQMERMRMKENEKTRRTNAKLPKLVITNFNGSSLDWL